MIGVDRAVVTLGLGALLSSAVATAGSTAATVKPDCSTVPAVTPLNDIATLSGPTRQSCEGLSEDPKLVLPDGIVTSIPEPGHGYTALAATTDGAETLEFSVATGSDGDVGVEYNGTVCGNAATLNEVIPGNTNPLVKTGLYSTTNKCSSTSIDKFSKSGHSWGGSYKWWYKASGQPSTGALSRLKATAGKWDGVVGACGTTIGNNAVQSYAGAATNWPSVNTTGGCTGVDGGSVAGWGAINDPNNTTLAVTCTYFFLAVLTEADIKFDTSSRSWFISSSTSGCSGKYDLQGVATHEYGHAFGLSHVASSSGQVMQPTVSTCAFTQRSLGYGDAYGIKSIYG